MAQIDIIVPVYNAEKYIRQCITSIQSQTFRDFRLIIVNDGSTDQSGYICDRFSDEDERIEVIHQKNRGVSAARNVGLAAIRSPHFCFVDADDMIHVDYLANMYQLMKEHRADLVICRFNIFAENEISIDLSEGKEISGIEVYTDTSQYAEKFKDDAMVLVSPTNKLYKRGLFKGISYPEGKVFEDDYVYYKVLDRSKCAVFTDAKLYEYRMQCQSITHEKYNLKMLNHVEAKSQQIRYFHEMKKQRLMEISLDAYMYWVWWNIGNMKKDGIDYRSKMKSHFRFLRKAVVYLRPTSTFPVKKVLKYWYLAYIKKI
ncbi:Glycosyltransferase involved in cell wall bisynthesis [Lachnospiraceae bacterium]|nr:Glycosyltransferase involved in cell wall bisynthesis [Lachnospiraceae bacterium]